MQEEYPSWAVLSHGSDSSFELEDPGTLPSLEFLRLQWDLSCNDVSDAVQILENAGDLQSVKTPWSHINAIARSSICVTPIGAVTISISSFESWRQAWLEGHDNHFYNFNTTGENPCGCQPSDAPVNPTLTITAPTGEFVSIGQYVEDVFQWLYSTRQEIRKAIGQFDDPLEPAWELIVLPMINRISVYTQRPGADLWALEHDVQQRVKVARRMQRDQEVEAQASLTEHSDGSLLRPYPTMLELEKEAKSARKWEIVEPSLELSRLHWSLISSDVHDAIFVVDDPADTSRTGPGVPFSYNQPVAAASICTSPISAVSIYIDVLESWHDCWDTLHHEDDPAPDTSVAVQLPKRRCFACGIDAPPKGPGPKLFIQAPSRYQFITVGQYVQEVFPWLRSLGSLIRRAITSGSSYCDKDESLSYKYDLTPLILCSHIQIYHNQPGLGLQLLEGMKRRRAAELARRQEGSRLQAAMDETTLSA